MIMTAENEIGAELGDIVEIDLETMNLLSATLIAYGIPLLALIIGIFAGYYGFLALGFSDGISQGFGAVIGLAGMAASYMLIKMNESKIEKMKKFKPILVGKKSENGF